MANKVVIDVGLNDQTQAGNASVVAGAEKTKLTLEQKHLAMLAAHRAAEEKFARDNAAIFLDIEHEKYAKAAEEFRQLQERNQRAAAKFLDDATRPLTPEQAKAGEAARAIIQQAPPPIVQRVVNDVDPIEQQAVSPIVQRVVNDAEPVRPVVAPPPIVQRVVTDAEPPRVTQPQPITQRVDVDQPPLITTPTLPPIVQRVEIEPIDAAEIQQAATIASKSIEALRADTTALMVAFQKLRANGLDNADDADIAHFTRLSEKLESTRAKVADLSQEIRKRVATAGDTGQSLAGFAEAIEQEVARGKQSIDGFAAKVRSEEEQQRIAATRTANIIDEVREQQAMTGQRRAEQAAAAFVQAEAEQQAAAQKTASIIQSVRDQQSQIANRAAEEAARAFLREEEAAAKAEQQFEQTTAAMRQIGEAAQKSASESQRLWREADEADRLAASFRKVITEIERSGDKSEETQQKLARLIAEEQQLGQSAPALRRQALEHENAARAAAMQGDALAATARAEGIASDQANRLTQSNQLLTKSFDAAAIARHRAELMATGVAMNDAQRGSAGAAQAMLQLGYAVDDVQYGMRGIVNNIPMLVQSMGGGAGLAGTLAIVGVVANQVANHWDELTEAVKRSGGTFAAAKSWLEILTQGARSYAQQGGSGMVEYLHSLGLVTDAMREQSRVNLLANDREEAFRAAKTLATKQLADQDKAAAKESAEIHAKEIKSLSELREKVSALKEEQIRAASVDLKILPEGEKAAAIARLEQVSTEFAAYRAELTQQEAAQKARLLEGAKLTEEAINRSRTQSAEIAKQTALTKELHEIELKRASITSGADSFDDESERVARESRREAHLDRMRQATEQAKQASERTASDENASDSQKAARRSAYHAAVMRQIEAEAESRKQKAEDVAAFEQLQANKMAALDAAAIEIRKRALADAQQEERRAIAADEAAKRDGGNQADVAHKKAADDRKKATDERIKAEGELAKQIAANEQRIHDTETRNDDARTKQRIADELAIGKARERASLEAAQREQAIEDAKNVKRKDALRAEPQIQEAAQQIQQRIDPREVERIALRRRQDEAERNLRAERMEAGEAIKAGEVAKVRREAGRDFIQDRNAGKAKAELAGVADELFAGAVDNARGLAEPVREALKAISREFAAKLRDAAAIEADVAKIKKEAPGDKAAAKRGETPDEREDRLRDELNERRRLKGLEPLDKDEKPAAPPPKVVAPPMPLRSPSEIAASLVGTPDATPKATEFREKLRGEEQFAKPTGATGGRPLDTTKEAPEVLDKKIADKERIISDAIAEATANGWHEINRRTLVATWEKAGGNVDWFRDYVKRGMESKRRQVAGLPDEEPENESEDPRVVENRKRLAEAEAARKRAEDAARRAGLNREQIAQAGDDAWSKSEKESWKRVTATADTKVAQKELDNLTKPRIVDVTVNLTQEQPKPLVDRNATDTITTDQQPRADITGQQVTDVVAVDQSKREPLAAQEVTDTVRTKQEGREPLVDRTATDTIRTKREPPRFLDDEPEQQREPPRFFDELDRPEPIEPQRITDTIETNQEPREPLVPQAVTDRVSVDQAKREPLAPESVTDTIGVTQQARDPLASQEVTDTITTDQQPRAALTGQRATDVVSVEQAKREPLAPQSVTDTIEKSQTPREILKPQSVTDRATVTAEADTTAADKAISALTRPRTVEITATTKQPKPDASSDYEIPTLPADNTGPKMVAAMRELVAATTKANAAKSRSDGEVLAALQKLTELQTDLANREESSRDVVAQVVDHVNLLQSQLVAQAGSTTVRSLRAGTV